MTEQPTPRSTPRFSLRALIDYLMGGIIGGVGLFFLFRQQFPQLPFNKHLGEPDRTDYLFGGLCLIYAAWRVIRGRRKSAAE